MTLPSSGSFKASHINVELGRSSSAQLKASDSAMRSLAGVMSGQYKASDLHGSASMSVVFDDVVANRILASPGYVYITLSPSVLGGASPITISFSESGDLSVSSSTATSITLRYYCSGYSGSASSTVTATVEDDNGTTIVAEALARIVWEIENTGGNNPV